MDSRDSQRKTTVTELQSALAKSKELNAKFSERLDDQVAYYEEQLVEMQDSFKDLSLKNEQLKSTIKSLEVDNIGLDIARKEIEIECERVKSDLRFKNEECQVLSNRVKELVDLDQSQEEENGEDSFNVLIRNESEEDFFENRLQNSDISNDSDEEVELGFSLSSELNNEIHELERSIEGLRFENKSLKNEKNQLYDYINKLLKNKPDQNQNEVLKSKMVNRRILRVVSMKETEQIDNRPNDRVPKKRVLSNCVPLMNYGAINMNKNGESNSKISSYNSKNDEPIINPNHVGHSVLLWRGSNRKCMTGLAGTPLDIILPANGYAEELRKFLLHVE